MRYQVSFFMLLLLWAGMILGISGLEAWVKFKTPSLEKIVALDVGRTVFRAFHRVQWGLWVSLLIIYYPIFYQLWWLALSLGLILLLQTVYLMPRLHQRIESLMNTPTLPRKAAAHHFYAIFEAIKLFLLLGSASYYLLEILCR